MSESKSEYFLCIIHKFYYPSTRETLEGWCTYKSQALCYNSLAIAKTNRKEGKKMAKRRMFSIDVITSDNFSLLPSSAQKLYLHLNMYADDDGVVDKWKTISRYLRVKREHLDSLVKLGYVIELGDDLLLISDWLVHNKIRKDRYVPGQYSDKLASIKLLPTGRYIKEL